MIQTPIELVPNHGRSLQRLISAAKMNGLDPYAYLSDVLERLPTQPASCIAELLPHRWQRR